MTSRANDPVYKVPDRKLVNRPFLSVVQVSILQHLAGLAPVNSDFVGHLPTTGGVIDAIGARRDRIAYASVSRSLRRLEIAGLVDCYRCHLLMPGKGFRYGLSDAGRIALTKSGVI